MLKVYLKMDIFCTGLSDNYPSVNEFLDEKIKNDKDKSKIQDLFKKRLILVSNKSRFVYF